MGTRSLTVVLESNSTEICVLYRQFDGHPSGHGRELKQFLHDVVVVSGLSLENSKRTANGMNCLAAQIVAHFKTEAGGFYLYPAGARDCGEEYIYTVYLKEDKIQLKIEAGTQQGNMPIIYDGDITLFNPDEVQRKWDGREENPPNDFIDNQVLSSEIVV
jgi:hypothetical protein